MSDCHQAVSHTSIHLLDLCRPLFKNFYFAFVQFTQLEHAKKALEELRFPLIKGFKCRALPFNKAGASQASMVAGDAVPQ